MGDSEGGREALAEGVEVYRAENRLPGIVPGVGVEEGGGQDLREVRGIPHDTGQETGAGGLQDVFAGMRREAGDGFRHDRMAGRAAHEGVAYGRAILPPEV